MRIISKIKEENSRKKT